MAENETTIWGIHGGSNGEADALFLKKGYVALGWVKMGDLSKLAAARDAFKAKVAEAYPDYKPGAVPTAAGQLFRFAHETKEGNLVIYPSKIDRQVHIGRIEGPYRYDPALGESYPNVRAVKWLRSVPRTKFSQGALYEIGSAMTFFQVKNFADEFLAALEGKPVAPPADADATVAAVAEDIEDSTRDFVLKRLAQGLKGHPLADFVAQLLGALGYRTRVSPPGPDGGVDIIAHKDELGFEPPIIKVQVKSSDSPIGNADIAALYGNVESKEHGLFVTLGTFTQHAKNFARGKSNLRLIDGDELVKLFLQHYDDLDARYKGLIPLKRVYVPEVLEEGEA